MSARSDWAPHFRRVKLLSTKDAERAATREVVWTTLLSVVTVAAWVYITYATIVGWLG